MIGGQCVVTTDITNKVFALVKPPGPAEQAWNSFILEVCETISSTVPVDQGIMFWILPSYQDPHRALIAWLGLAEMFYQAKPKTKSEVPVLKAMPSGAFLDLLLRI